MKRTPLPPRKNLYQTYTHTEACKMAFLPTSIRFRCPPMSRRLCRCCRSSSRNVGQIRRLFTFSAIPTIFQSHPTRKAPPDMFTELLPLLKERTLTMTVSMLKGSSDRLSVCIVPKQFEYTKPDIGYDKDAEALSKKIETASSALNTPLSITGTAAEIDASLPKALADYATEMQSLHCDIDQVRKDLEAAKAALDEAKKSQGQDARGEARHRCQERRDQEGGDRGKVRRCPNSRSLR